MKTPIMLIAGLLLVMAMGGLLVLKGCYPSSEAQASDGSEARHIEALEAITANVGLLMEENEALREEVERLRGVLAAWKDKIIVAAEQRKADDEKQEKKRMRDARASWGRIYSRPIATEDDEVAISRTSEVILHFMKKAPHRKLAKDETLRYELAADIYYSASRNDIPHFLWAAQTFKESSYRIDAKGDAGEGGMSQVHGRASEGCDLVTQYGQLECGAKWLAKCREQCETWEEALTKYASGHCRTSSSDLQKKVAERIRDWMDLEATY
jgi:hypothetical protein